MIASDNRLKAGVKNTFFFKQVQTNESFYVTEIYGTCMTVEIFTKVCNTSY